DGVHADRVLVAEGLALGVDRGERELRRVERIDPGVRRPARMRRASHEACGLSEPPVVRARHARWAVLGTRSRVDHHREIDVVQVAEAQKLTLAAQELEPSGAHLVEPPLEIAALLGGHGHERHAAREELEGARFEKADRRADEPRDLGVVAARVCGARHWVRLRVSGDPEGVELSDEGESRPGPGAAGDVRANARQSEAGSRDEAEAAELLRDECRGLQLLEAELGMAPDGLADTDDLVGVALDGLADTL